jgi:hypothetical protein
LLTVLIIVWIWSLTEHEEIQEHIGGE